MSTWTEYDPFTGVQEINVADEMSGTLTVRKQMDVEPLLDATKALANEGMTDIGIKKGLWHYCSIPLPVQYEMLTLHGVNVQDKNHWPKVFDLVNKHYPYLKTTHKNHAYKGQGKVFEAISLKHRNSPSAATLTPPGTSLIDTSSTNLQTTRLH